MSSTQKERRCRVCKRQIAPGRCRRFPTATTCGGEPCTLAMRSQKLKYASQYEPPAEGSPDSADPLFRAKVRPCGRCGQIFKQSVRWRYFCERCRYSTVVKSPPTDRTYELSTSSRRSGG